MDLFEEWLNEEKGSIWIRRALTDKSYKNYINKCKSEKSPDYHSIKSCYENTDLATLGDAVIKLGYTELLLDRAEKLTVEKEKFESDRFFVAQIARHYDLLSHMLFDINDIEMPHNYDYEHPKDKGKKSPHKYIATCVEAIIGAIYKELLEKDGSFSGPMVKIEELLESWMGFNDDDNK